MTRLWARLRAWKRPTRRRRPTAPLLAPERLPSLRVLHRQLLEAGEKQPPYDWDSADILDRCFGPEGEAS